MVMRKFWIQRNQNQRQHGHHEAEQIESRRNCGIEHISHVKFQYEFTCVNCNNIPINETQVRCHIRNHHEFYYIRETIQDEEELVAPLCVIMSQNKRKLRRHMSRDHNDRGKLTCKSCGNLFDEQKDLRVHVTSKYENNEGKEGSRLSTSMVSIITMICRLIKVYKNKLGLSQAKLSHNWGLKL